MKKDRFQFCICVIIVSMMLSLRYVHQEVEIVKTSFQIRKSKKELSFLLDQHRGLVYNLSRLESPKRIEDTLCNNEIVLCMPLIENVKRINSLGEQNGYYKINDRRESILARIFDRLSVKAEAKVVK